MDAKENPAQKTALPYLAFGGCAAIWGSTFLVIRVGNDSLPPLYACSLRMACACVILSLVLLATRQPWPKGPALRAAFWYGFWEFGVSMSLLYWGEKTLPSGLSAVLFAVCPISAMFEARLLGMEKLNPKKIGAALLAFFGVVIIFWRETAHQGSPLPMIAVFLAAAAAPIAALMLQRGPAQNPFASNAVATLVGFMMTLTWSSAIGEHHVLPRSPAEYLPVLYLAIAGSTLAFTTFAWLLNHWKTSTVAFIGVTIPVIAVTLGWAFRHETLAAESLVGAVVVIVGVAIALRIEATG